MKIDHALFQTIMFDNLSDYVCCLHLRAMYTEMFFFHLRIFTHMKQFWNCKKDLDENQSPHSVLIHACKCILNTFKNTNKFDHENLFSYTCPSSFKTALIRLDLNQSRNIISWKSIKYWIIILTVKPLCLTQYLSIIYQRIYQQNAKPWHRRVQIYQKFL